MVLKSYSHPQAATIASLPLLQAKSSGTHAEMKRPASGLCENQNESPFSIMLPGCFVLVTFTCLLF